MDRGVEGKVAIITGGSDGIGRAAAERLSAEGAFVAIVSRTQSALDVTAKEIWAQTGNEVMGIAADVRSEEAVKAMVAKVASKWGGIDILINNAATNPYFGDILDTDLGAYTKTVDVNIRGYFFMCVEGGKLMRDNGGGSIVNTASINALKPGPMQGIYSISKAAVVNMTQAFAKECGRHGIRVNALLPGLTKTKFAGALFANEKILNDAIKNIPLHRHAEPDEMAGTVLYLVSDASTYTTGECIVVDGGLTL